MDAVLRQGSRLKEKRNLRIQGRMQIFRKMSQKALNRDLTVPQHSTRRGLSGTTLKIQDNACHAKTIKSINSKNRIK